MKAAHRHRMRDLCEITSSKRIFAADYQSEGVPFYRGKEITEKHKGNLDVTTELYIAAEKFEAIQKKFGAPVAGDLLLTSVGTLGSPYVVRPGEKFYFKDGNLTWFRKLNGLDGKFLYYWLLSPFGREELKKCTIGSSQSAYTIVLLKDMEIDLPDFPTQRRIAGILSAYDDLIENNLRRIRILEEMAQSLYREWFVHFRFPGHESVPLVDSPLGPIPQGWEVKKVLDYADVIYGYPFKSKQFNTDGEGEPVVRIRDVPKGRSETFTLEEGNPKHRIKNGDILVGMDGDFHMSIWSGGAAWQNQRVAKFRPKSGMGANLLFRILQAPIQFFNATITGTTVAHLGDKHIKTIEFAAPSADLLGRASEVLEPWAAEQLNLKQRNQLLRQARDLLLPKLLSRREVPTQSGNT